MISAETTLPRAHPVTGDAAVKVAERFKAGSAGVPTAVVVATVSPCATSRAVAVSSPERCSCQLSWSSTQPEYIAKRGTSGIAVSIDSDGSVQLPERNSCVQGPEPLVTGAPKAAFNQKPKASASTARGLASAVTASLIGAIGSRPSRAVRRLRSGCSAPTGAGEGHPSVPARWRGAVGRLEPERHLRPRALGACHVVSRGEGGRS